MAGVSKPQAPDTVSGAGAAPVSAQDDRYAPRNEKVSTQQVNTGLNASRGADKDWGYSKQRVLGLGAGLLLAVVVAIIAATRGFSHSSSGSSLTDSSSSWFGGNGLKSVSDAANQQGSSNTWRDSLDEVAKQMSETKDEAVRKVLETYHGSASKAATDSDSWKAKYQRAYQSAQDQANRMMSSKKREDSVTDKLRDAYKSMQEQVGLAQSDYQKTYDEAINDSVESMRKKMQDGMAEVQKQYKKGKISAKEAERLIEEKTGLAKKSGYVALDDDSISSRLEKAYNDMHKKTRDARSSYVKAYDDAYYGGKSAAQRVKDGAASVSDSASNMATGAYETVTDLPNAVKRKASEAYHGAKAAQHHVLGSVESGSNAAEHKAQEMYHRGQMSGAEAEQEASGILGSIKAGARDAAASIRDAGNSASQACYDAVFDTKTQFDVAYEQASQYLSDTADSVKQKMM